MTTEHKPLTAAEIVRDTVYVERVTNGKECGENCPCSYVNREDEWSCILDGKELACAWEPERGNVCSRTPKCLSLLTPPPDAAVREAVEYIGEVLDNVRCHLGICGPGDDGERKADASDNWGILDALDECRTLLSYVRAAQAPRLTEHTDDLAVDDFAAAMKAKLAQKRTEGRSGWDDPDECHIGFLVSLLHGHIQKGDPIDIANIAMMLWSRGLRGNGSVPAPRLTGERLEAVKQVIERLGTLDGAMWPKEKRSLWYRLRAAFPELGEGEWG